jgi:hypothetical protein
MDFGLSSPTAVTGGVLVPSAGQPPGLDHRAMETIRSLDRFVLKHRLKEKVVNFSLASLRALKFLVPCLAYWWIVCR